MPRRFRSRKHAAPTRLLWQLPLRLALALGLALLTLPVLTSPAAADPPGSCGSVVSFKQNTDKDGNGDWVDGSINDKKGNLVEGGFVWQQVVMKDLPAGQQQVTLTYQYKQGGKYAYDHLDNFSVGEASVVVNVSSPTASPDGTKRTVTATWDQPDGVTTQTLTFGAHIASELDWGPGMGAGSISGASYHVYLDRLNCKDTGQMDNQIMAAAVEAGRLTVVKDAVPDAPDDFHFSLSPGGDGADFVLDDDPSSDTPNSVTYWVPPNSYTVTEGAAEGWTLAGVECSPITGTSDGRSVTIAVADDANVTCTFTNTRDASVTVDKYWRVDGADPVPNGQQPEGMSAALTLDGPGDAGTTQQAWGQPRGGYTDGDQVTIDESTTLPENCSVTGRTISAGDDKPVDLPDNGYLATLGGGSNSYSVTNSVTCTHAASVRVDKYWAINGGNPVPNGQQAGTISATLTLTGPGDASASQQDWGQARDGYTAGDDITIDESATLPETCRLTGRTIKAGAGDPQPLGDNGYAATLAEGANDYAITNAVTCTRPASVRVDKFWRIDGGDPIANGQQPGDMKASLTLAGPGDAPASDQSWGQAVEGYTAGDEVTIDESATLPENCSVTGRTITAGGGAPQALGDNGYAATLIEGSNTYTVTNSVTCSHPASVTVDKFWRINGGDPIANGKQPEGINATLTLTGPNDGPASQQAWGEARQGYAAGDEVTIDESTTLPQTCRVTGRTIAVGNEDPQTLGDNGYLATLAEGTNGYSITNSVTCTTPPPPPPPATSRISVLKLDAETQDPLAGAQFQAYRDTNGNGAPDTGDQALGAPVTTAADGTAAWSGLGYGTYLVVETKAPTGYDLPANAYQVVSFGAGNAGTTARLVFLDGPQGSIGIVKAAFEKEGGSWVASDGEVPFGSTVRYVMTLTATGPKVHQDVTVGDYVPGYDPADSASTGQADYVDGSASCDPGPCTTSYDATTHQVTWDLGDMRATTQSVAFEVRIPQPDDPTFVDGVFTQVFANTASMGWTDRTRGPQVLPSNRVTVEASVEVLPAEAIVPPPGVQPQHQARPPQIQGVQSVLPATGAEAGTAWLLSVGGLAVVLGSWLALRERRRTS